MARSHRTSTAINDDELQALTEFCKRYDKRLSETPTFLDVVRSLRRIAGREIRNDNRVGDRIDRPLENPTNDGTVQPETLPQPATPRFPKESVSDRPSAKLAQQITLEREKSRTLWLRAVNAGKLIPQNQRYRNESAALASNPSTQQHRRFLCKLHAAIHDNGPCDELLAIQRETGQPLEIVAKFREGGGYLP